MPEPARPQHTLLSPTARYVPALWFLLVAVLGYGGVLEWGATHGPLGAVEEKVSAYLDRSETTAVEAFAVARAINAAVSLLKSADLSAVVAQIAPLQVLEPVDDLAKQFSDVMVVSIVAIQMQRLLLMISRAWAFAILLPVGCVLVAAALALPRTLAWRTRLARLGRLVIVAAVFARCIVLIAGLVGNSLTERFLAGDLHATMSVLRASGTHLTEITANTTPPVVTPPPEAPPAADSVLGKMESSVAHALQSARNSTQTAVGQGESLLHSAGGWIPDRAAITAFLAQVPDQIVRAIEIFLVQTMVTPLLVAAALYAALRVAMKE